MPDSPRASHSRIWRMVMTEKYTLSVFRPSDSRESANDLSRARSAWFLQISKRSFLVALLLTYVIVI